MMIGSSSLTTVAFSPLGSSFTALAFLVGVPFLPIRPAMTPSFFFVAGVFGFLGVDGWDELDALEAKLVLAVPAVGPPRGGAGARAPESISALSTAASRLIIRKRPSIES